MSSALTLILLKKKQKKTEVLKPSFIFRVILKTDIILKLPGEKGGKGEQGEPGIGDRGEPGPLGPIGNHHSFTYRPH